FDPSPATYNMIAAGSNDIFISKLDSSGNFIWAKQFSGTNNEEGLSINTDAAGNIYTTGFFNGTTDFDPGAGIYNLTSAGMADVFVSKLDSSGNFIWASRFGGTNNDLGLSITS